MAIELTKPKFIVHLMSKLLSSFTLHLLNQKFSFHFFFFYPAFPSNPEANSNFKFQHLFKLRDHIEGTIYPSGQFSRTSKIFNQYIPEIHTPFHQAHPWVLFTSDQAIFLHKPSLMSAVTRAEYCLFKDWKSFPKCSHTTCFSLPSTD